MPPQEPTPVVNPPPGPTEPDPTGVWVLSLNASCSWAFVFNGQRFVDSTFCVTPDGNGLQDRRTDGTFSIAGGVLVFSAEESSCADWPKASHISIAVNGNALILTTPAKQFIFTKNTAMPSGGPGVAITFGCFKAGVFTASPIAALP